MRHGTSKHIVGIAIFVVVISAFVIYFAPKSPPEDGFEVYSVPPERLQHLEIKAPKKFKVFLNSIQYDETSERFTAQLDLEWDGTLPNPKELNVVIRIVTKQERPLARSIHEFTIMHPFKDDARRTIDIGWKDDSFLRLNREPEYFAYAEIRLDSEIRHLLYVERDPLTNTVPLSIIPSQKRSDK